MEESVAGIFISPARFWSPAKKKKKKKTKKKGKKRKGKKKKMMMMMMKKKRTRKKKKIEKIAGICVVVECGVGKIGDGFLYRK